LISGGDGGKGYGNEYGALPKLTGGGWRRGGGVGKLIPLASEWTIPGRITGGSATWCPSMDGPALWTNCPGSGSERDTGEGPAKGPVGGPGRFGPG